MYYNRELNKVTSFRRSKDNLLRYPSKGRRRPKQKEIVQLLNDNVKQSIGALSHCMVFLDNYIVLALGFSGSSLGHTM